MEELRIQRVSKALGLKRQIIGVRFLVFKREYEESKGIEEEDITLCQLVEQAGNGKRVKAKADSFRCLSGAYAVGICDTSEEESSGRKDYNTGRYESLAIARKIFENKQYMQQKIYGIECSPLETMGADFR